MGDIAKGILRGCQGLFTPVSLGYPLSVFNKKLYSQKLTRRVLDSEKIPGPLEASFLIFLTLGLIQQNNTFLGS